MLNMESPQMYDTVQTLSQLDLKKPPSAAIIGQITLTAMANNGSNAANNTNGAQPQSNGGHHNGLVVKQQQSALHMQQAAAANNNNNSATANNNNNNNNSILQKHMLQQYAQNDLDELTAQEITLDLQHLIDDQFRDQETLGIFNDMVASPGSMNGGGGGGLQANGVVSAAAKVLQLQQQQQHQQNLRSQQTQHGYGRNTLAYMPQAVHSGATYASNNSSDDNSSVGSEASTIKEEPIDPQEYRRQLQDSNFLGAVTNNANGLYPSLGGVGGGYGSAGNGGNFTNLTPSGVLHHQSGLPHLGGGPHLNSLKHHSKSMLQRKNSNKSVDKGTDEYRRRRERNNIAVRKSREKAKVRSREVEEKVKTLLKEKDALMRRLEEMTTEIQLHKQIYMQLMNHTNPEVSRICRSFLNMNEHGI